MKKWLIAFASVMLAACHTTSDDDDSVSMFSELSEQNFSSIYEAELYYNYVMLDMLYLYAHTRNELADDYSVYLNKGTEEVNYVKDGYCTEKFYDVCYMYNQMRDPFTRYFDPNIAEKVLSMVMESESSVGIGAEVEEIVGNDISYLVVTQVYPKSPAEKAGLKQGDIIYMVDGVTTTNENNFDGMCAGNSGDVRRIVVGRGADTVVVAVTLGEYKEPSVKITYQDSIPVIQLTEFVTTSVSDSGSYGEFIDALNKTQGAPATIIDLRDNPGGETSHCINMASELLSKGDTILINIQADVDSVREGRGWRYFQIFDTITYTATQDGLAKDRYYVLMADTGSASCAEIFLAAITANKKSPIVGQLTYGKGIGQGVLYTEEVAGGLALITAMQFYDKNWNSYHDLGFVPDYPIDSPDEQMAKAVELAKGLTAMRVAGFGTQKLEHFSKARVPDASNKIPTARDLKLAYKLMNR